MPPLFLERAAFHTSVPTVSITYTSSSIAVASCSHKQPLTYGRLERISVNQIGTWFPCTYLPDPVFDCYYVSGAKSKNTQRLLHPVSPMRLCPTDSTTRSCPKQPPNIQSFALINASNPTPVSMFIAIESPW
jgi:hypothetical protein